MSFLSSVQRDTCLYTGVGGMLLSAACMIQILALSANLHWVVFSVAAVFSFSLEAYVFLMRLKAVAPLLITVSTGAVFLSDIVLFLSGLFSFVTILLFLYSVIITAIVYGGGYNKILLADEIARKKDRDEWAGKI